MRNKRTRASRLSPSLVIAELTTHMKTRMLVKNMLNEPMLRNLEVIFTGVSERPQKLDGVVKRRSSWLLKSMRIPARMAL